MSLRTYGGGICLPVNRPIETVASLHEHLQAAMAVELSTIPLYLYAMYSVSPATPDAAKAVHDVVIEEMLHLALAGNTLLAVGGTPKLYDPKIIPAYPTPMLGRVPELILHLRQMTKENLNTFIQVELPESASGQSEPDLYQTLGQFYQAIEDGLKYLNDRDPKLFNTASANAQFGPDSIYKSTEAGGLVSVTDLASALQALTIIVDQGEGKPSVGRPYDDDDKSEKDHYDVFLDLQQDKTLTWDVLPVVTDPTTVGYLGRDPKIYAVSLTFDAAFCYLLLTLEKLWAVSSAEGRKKLTGNIFKIMVHILKPLACFLTQQQIGSSGKVAAPVFGYFGYKSHHELCQLKGALWLAIVAYTGNTQAQADLLTVQEAVDELVDINDVKPGRGLPNNVCISIPAGYAGQVSGITRANWSQKAVLSFEKDGKVIESTTLDGEGQNTSMTKELDPAESVILFSADTIDTLRVTITHIDSKDGTYIDSAVLDPITVNNTVNELDTIVSVVLSDDGEDDPPTYSDAIIIVFMWKPKE